VTVTQQPDPTSTGTFVHTTVAIIRHVYTLTGQPPVSEQMSGHATEFDPRVLQVEVATDDKHTILRATISGCAIITLSDGERMTTTMPCANRYGPHEALTSEGLGTLPEWVAPIIADATARTREAWA